MGFLNKLFGSKEVEFQKQILRTLDAGLVQISSNPMKMVVGGVEIDVADLHKTCMANEVQSADFIRQHFSFPLAFAIHEVHSWNEIESLLRPQLAPSAVAALFDIPTFPFVDPIASCIVIKKNNL